MASPVLGIDLGTTNSVVAVFEGSEARVVQSGDGNRLLPSVVSFHPSGRVLVGHSARERRMVDASNTVFSVKRLIGRPFRSVEVRRAAEMLPFSLSAGQSGGVTVEARGQSYSLPEISALVLRQLRKIAETDIGASCLSAVVTVPANFNDLQRTATRDAGRIAGLDVLRILNEPTAAALAYGYAAGTNERIAVYDLGGGTFDISVLDLSGDVVEVVATAGDSYLGGDDIDSAIADRMARDFLRRHHVDLTGDRRAYERLRLAAEWLKCQLSASESATCRVEEVAYGVRGRAIDLEFSLTRAELDKITFPIVGRTFDICEEALRIAGVRPSQLDNVVLVGGQTVSPFVRRMVADYFGRKPLSEVNPSEVVARGAAIVGHMVSGGSFRAPRPASTRPGPRPQAAGSLASAALQDQHPGKGTLLGVGSKRPPQQSVSRLAPPPPAAGRPSRPSRLGGEGGARTQTLGRVQLRPSTRPPASEARPAPPAGALRAPPPPQDGRRVPPPPPAIGASSPPQAPPFARPDSVRPGEAEPLREQLSPSAERRLSESEPSIEVPISEPPELSAASEPPPPPEPPPAPPAAPIVADAIPDPQGPFDDAATAPAPAAMLSSRPPPAQRAALSSRPPAAVRADAIAPSNEQAFGLGTPLLLDVTPHTLAIETTGGFCEGVIERNAPIPTEQTRRFSTSQDNQEMVRVRVCQGEERKVTENQELGAVELLGLRRGPRGEVKIDVTFMIDADGTLDVTARDEATGKAQEIRIDLVGALSDDEVAQMRERQALLGWE